MKIDIRSIVIDHWRTLYNARSECVAYADICTFYIVPLVMAVVSYFLQLKLKPDHYNASITFFGVFVALLLNIQVAIFSIFQRKWEPRVDRRQGEAQSREIDARRVLLSELNANISYLTVFSCLSLLLFLMFYVFDMNEGIAPAIAAFLYLHFLLTLLMILKRSHALFQKEYRDRAL